MRSIEEEMKGKTAIVTGGMEFGTIPKYYAFDESNAKMKQLEAEGAAEGISQQ